MIKNFEDLNVLWIKVRYLQSLLNMSIFDHPQCLFIFVHSTPFPALCCFFSLASYHFDIFLKVWRCLQNNSKYPVIRNWVRLSRKQNQVPCKYHTVFFPVESLMSWNGVTPYAITSVWIYPLDADRAELFFYQPSASPFSDRDIKSWLPLFLRKFYGTFYLTRKNDDHRGSSEAKI